MTDSVVNSWIDLLADRDREHLGLQARALADRARPKRHVLLDPLALRSTSRSRGSGAGGSRRCRRTRACTGAAAPCGCGTGRRSSRRRCRRGSGPAPPRSARTTASTCRSRSGRRSPGSRPRRSPDEPPTDHGTSAPSSIESDGSGTSRSGSISCCEPRPVQRGQAPCGALKEKIRGCSSGSETPWSGQAKFSREEQLLAGVDEIDRDEPFGERGSRLDRLRQPQRAGRRASRAGRRRPRCRA